MSFSVWFTERPQRTKTQAAFHPRVRTIPLKCYTGLKGTHATSRTLTSTVAKGGQAQCVPFQWQTFPVHFLLSSWALVLLLASFIQLLSFLLHLSAAAQPCSVLLTSAQATTAPFARTEACSLRVIEHKGAPALSNPLPACCSGKAAAPMHPSIAPN